MVLRFTMPLLVTLGFFVLAQSIALAQTETLSKQVAATKPLYWEGDHLLAIREAKVHTPAITQALKELRLLSDIAKARGPYSVVDKSIVPPSGDKHDYLSYSRYWWPDPKTKDGLPYLRKDGLVNRKMVAKGDRTRLANFCDDVESTALASYLLSDDEAGKHAKLLLTTWFLKSETRMTPRIEYGQGVLGRSHGRAVGILDARNFLRLFDAIELLEAGGYLMPKEIAGIRDWFREYDEWLEASPLAETERNATNNHGTWFYAQEVGVAMFIGRKEKASQLLQHIRDVRLAEVIDPDGSQPSELTRTLSMHYSYFQLEAFMHLARFGEQLNVDLFSYESPNGSSLRGAFEYLLPYLVENYDDWPYEQIKKLKPSDNLLAVFMLASNRWNDDRYMAAMEKAPRREDRIYLSPLLFSK